MADIRRLYTTVFDRLSAALSNLTMAAYSQDSDQDNSSSTRNFFRRRAPLPYSPTVDDVFKVKKFISQCHPDLLPPEIVDLIMDHAEYWPSSVSAMSKPKSCVVPNENLFVLRSTPLGFPLSASANTPIRGYPYEQPPSPLQPHPLAGLDESTKSLHEDMLAQWKEQSAIRGASQCRKIIFTLKSRDQGWGGNPADRGSYNGAYSWFDVGLERVELRKIGPDNLQPYIAERMPTGKPSPNQGSFSQPSGGSGTLSEDITIAPSPTLRIPPGHILTIRNVSPAIVKNPTYKFDHPFLPPPTRLQSNVVAKREATVHTITWHYLDDTNPESNEGAALVRIGRGKASATGQYVRDLKVGDIVTLWARARFGGWANHVEEAKIEVFWAV